ncbi:hypothetical protein Aperf_G00000093819 [Anoplocephala perfoliata]
MVNIVTALCLLTLTGWALASGSSSQTIEPLAVCDFDENDTCGWLHEESVWAQRWATSKGSLCLSPKAPSTQSSKKPSLWISSLSGGQKKKTFTDIRVRFTSPPISPIAGVRCLTLVYSIDLKMTHRDDLPKQNGLVPGLSLLQQQEGNGSTCGWLNEEGAWSNRWSVSQGALCLTPRKSHPPKEISSWLPGLPVESRKPAADIRVRFTSPPVPPVFGLKCIAFIYSIESKSRMNLNSNSSSCSLAFLQHHEEYISQFRISSLFGSIAFPEFPFGSRPFSSSDDMGFHMVAITFDAKHHLQMSSPWQSATSIMVERVVGLLKKTIWDIDGYPNKEFSRPDVKPLSICDFNNGGICGWINEEADWRHRWIVDRGSLCFKARQPSAPMQNADASSWIPGISAQSVEEVDLTARFKSPSVPSSVGLKFRETFNHVSFLLEPSPSDIKPLAICDFTDDDNCGWINEETLSSHRWTIDRYSLCLAAKQPFVLSPRPKSSWIPAVSAESLEEETDVTARFKSPFVPSSIESSESLRPKPLATCDFNDGDTCGWIHEEAVWIHRWATEVGSLCLKAKATSPQKKKSSSWFAGISSEKSSEASTEVSVRFTSPPIPPFVGLKCIAFSYFIDLGHGKDTKPSLKYSGQGSPPTLSFIEYPFSFLPDFMKPLHVWTFDEGDMEEWSNDNDNWQQKWRISEANLPSSSICVSARSSRKSSSSKLSPVLSFVDKKSSPRLWSPGVSGKLGISCLTLQFVIEKAEFIPKPYIVWNFDESLEEWANDLSNYDKRWELIDGAICLHNVQAKSKLISNRRPWAKAKKEEQKAKTTKASFWSPPIPQDLELRCIKLLMKPYIVWSFDDSLDDWVNDAANWDQKWELIDGAVCLHNVQAKSKLISNRRPWTKAKNEEKNAKTTKASFWSPPIPQDLELRCIKLPQMKPYYIWNFDDSLDDWVNDAANWDQKWELIDGAVCLHNVPVKSKLSSRPKPWANLISKNGEKTIKNVKTSLWSPPIPQGSGMRCITMGYRMSQGSKASQIYSLALLQQQDGFAVRLLLSSGVFWLLWIRDISPFAMNTMPKPYFVWTFDKSMGDWSNDAANWFQKWELVNGTLCLQNIQLEPKEPSDNLLWPVSKTKAEKPLKSSKAPLWSRPIPQDIGLRCITMDYQISRGSRVSQPYSLTVLQQQDGVFLRQFDADESLPKPFYVWTFNENMGKWANDLSNWNQKWELIDGTVCLKNILAEPETAEDGMPWFAVKSKSKETTPKSSKAPLWSPPIPESTGMRCITMDYNIHMDSNESKSYSLAVLQQQDG